MDLRERGQFLEWAQVHGSLYGTRRDETERLLDEGFDLILDIDVQGAAQVKRNMPEAVTVFILPPSRQVLESRLRSRNLNEPLDLRRRLVNAAREVRFYEEFDYLIVNDDLERAAAVLGAIILADRHRSKRQRARGQAIIDTFGGELLHA
jgi:guanylate kinase